LETPLMNISHDIIVTAPLSCALLLFLYSYCPHPALPSFPTRRSSDLVDDTHIIVGNDNNLPFSSSREPNKADDDEFVLLEVGGRSEEHTSELQSHLNLVCRLLLEKKKRQTAVHRHDSASQHDRHLTTA